MISLSGKRILVTGASSGIGRATAKLCDSLGAKVVLTARNEVLLKEVKSEMSDETEFFMADLTNETDIDNLIENIGVLDGFFHSAGVIQPYPIKYIRRKNIDYIYSVNLNSAILLTAGLIKNKKINPNASLVFISSISTDHPYMGGALYSSSKSALESFSKSIALEFASQKIRSNVLQPALVETEMFEQTKSAYSEQEFSQIIQQYPLGIGKPSDIASAAVFLLSDSSSWITGTTLKMDGGLLLNSRR
jgi:NAD(P)-dependent dehydrogenase (short-subunit alcohol dehydrogenase family)